MIDQGTVCDAALFLVTATRTRLRARSYILRLLNSGLADVAADEAGDDVLTYFAERNREGISNATTVTNGREATTANA